MKLKRLFLGASIAVLGLSLASCKEDKEIRNTVTPYGSLQNQLSTTIATANNNLSMTLDQYYTQLRYNNYSLITEEIEKVLYKNEVAAITAMYENESLSALSSELVETLKIKDTNAEGNDTYLFDLNQEKYAELRTSLYENINNTISSSIFATTDAETIIKKTSNEIKEFVATFVDSQSKIGNIISVNDIKWITPDSSEYTLTKESNLIQFSDETLDKLSNIVEAEILSVAKNYSAQKALYKIADEEYITEYDEEKEKDIETKNKNYLFEDSDIESSYNNSFKTFGTYNAIIIQFNSRREALNAINGTIDAENSEAALATYLDLYNKYYSYKLNETITNTENEAFVYTINEKTNDFEDVSDSISSLITDVLEDGEYLTEPRNINNKYVLAYRIGATYDYHEEGNASNQLDYDKLSSTQKEEINQKIKENLIVANASSYKTTDLNKKIDAADLKIYDPYFEYKFEYSYANYYDSIEETVKADSNLIFSIGEDNYTVEEFYADASKINATSIINNHFQLEYANLYYDQYVDEALITENLADDNKDALNTAIDTFKDDKNATYPVELGLETYLLAAYGYKTKDDVLKYYYNAKKALDTYKAKYVFEEWSAETTADGKTVYKISEDATTGLLKNLLETGNSTYNSLFNINLDHILINIDDNADGTPDDPADFLSKNPTIKSNFENAVTELAQAIYLEAIHEDYKDNTLYETLTYIKTQYEEGANLLSQPDKTWDDYKDFNFLLTVEQLASSGDITQESVNNFVVPFKEYVIDVYKTAYENGVDTDFEDGVFYFCYPENGETVGTTATTDEDASLITFDALCATNYGYHMLVLNSYETPSSTRFNASDDVSGFQSNLQIVIRDYEKDDEEVSIYVNTDSYNDSKTSASINQFFIYYVQKQNGAETSLDADINTIMSSLFDDVIATYTSANFQNFLMLDYLDITINDVEIAGHKVNTEVSNIQMNIYKNAVLEYGSNDTYTKWFDGTYTWDRPDQIEE